MQRGNGAVIGKQNTPTTSVATGVWALNEVQRAVLGGNWPASTIVDPYFENVSLLLHGNGTNGAQNNTFLDSSTNNFTITRNGNTTQGTFTPYGSNWSNYFDGTGDYLTAGTTSSFNFMHNSTALFTLECWVYRTVGSVAQVLWSTENTTSTLATGCLISCDATNKLNLYIVKGSSGQYVVTGVSTGTVPVNQWVHIAVTYDQSLGSNNATFYINGVASGNATKTANAPSNGNSTNAGTIGRGNEPGSEYYFTGYISNLRVNNSIVYSSAFTPPTAPLTAITNTSLLTCQSNRFIDNSTNNFTITRNGDVSVQRFSPFNPTAAYSAATIGGSGYFDGSGDSLTTSSSAVSYAGDFCIECWFYTSTTTVYASLYSDETGSSGGTILLNNGSANGQITVYLGSIFNFASTSTGLNNNAWHHVALTRSGSTVRLFIDGNLENTTTASGTITSPGTVRVGSSYYANRDFSGYIAGFRIVSGSAVYTSAFTPPTAPPTAITNTSLLLNYTNGGIIDNAMMNDLETVGNAQISTSVSKFGGGSLAFDGTGDYLFAPSRATASLEGDFTIEYWIYRSVSGSTSIFTLGDSFTASGIETYIGSSGTAFLLFSGNAARISSSSLPAVGAWSHVAAVRSGSTITLYLNGVSLGTWSSSTTFSGALYVGTEFYNGSVSGSLNGYIDDLRITKGYARYTADFTPPTLPFPDQ